MTSLTAAKFLSTLPAAPLFPLCYGLSNPLSPICQLCFSCSGLSREFPLGFALTRIFLVCHFADLKLRNFLVENETFSDFLHRNLSMPSAAVGELLDADINLRQVKSTFRHQQNAWLLLV